jgi:Cys-tRNA(Pro)/Cys-tRNA(Cys) deacylase
MGCGSQDQCRALARSQGIGGCIWRSQASLDRKLHLVAVSRVKLLQALTGYIRGGVTVFDGKNNYPVYVDQSIERFERVSVSGGIRGMQLLLCPADDLRLTQAQWSALAQSKK